MKIDLKHRRVSLDPRNPAFVQDPYPYYAELHARCPLFFWEEYGFWCLAGHRAVSQTLRDPRFGRQILHLTTREALGWEEPPPHLAPFVAFEAHSLLEVEPPVHTRLRRLVNRAFVSRQIAHLKPRITERAHALVDALEVAGKGGTSVDLLSGYATPIPVAVICWLLGVPEDRAPDLLRWSHAMVAMYQANRTRAVEDAAVEATLAFTAYIRSLLIERRDAPGPDLLSELIRARDEDGSLSEDELITTAILLLNAGHEATVHTLGNGIRALLSHSGALEAGASSGAGAGVAIGSDVVEEILRYDPPLHLFTRYALQPLDLVAHETDAPVHLAPGDRVGLLLGAANRDPAAFPDPHRFDPERLAPERMPSDAHNPGPVSRHVSFGGGIHFCLGAPLARLELEVGLSVLFARAPRVTLAEVPRVADRYHFRGVEALPVHLHPRPSEGRARATS
jgi:cytochrome P450